MARAKFKESEVLDSTTSLFWRHGFQGVSVQHLVEATGMQPGSLYHAFGSKEKLFLKALKHYAEQTQKRILHTLFEAPTVGEGVCRLLESMIEESGQTGYCSCFLIKTRLEIQEPAEALTYVTAQMKANEELFANALAPEYGEAEAAQRAASLMLHIAGLRIYGYLEKDPDRLLDTLQLGLPWLPWTARQVD